MSASPRRNPVATWFILATVVGVFAVVLQSGQDGESILGQTRTTSSYNLVMPFPVSSVSDCIPLNFRCSPTEPPVCCRTVVASIQWETRCIPPSRENSGWASPTCQAIQPMNPVTCAVAGASCGRLPCCEGSGLSCTSDFRNYTPFSSAGGTATALPQSCFVIPRASAANPICGNGTLDPWEECDGQQLRWACSDLGFDAGTISCRTDCTINVNACYDLPPPVFSSAGGGCNIAGGTCETNANCCTGLSCARVGTNPGTCMTTAARCGDGVRNGNEQCDGGSFTATCGSLGLPNGILRCNSACTFDTSSCVASPPLPPTPQGCGLSGQECTSNMYTNTCCNGLSCNVLPGATRGTCSANSCLQIRATCSTNGTGLPCCNGLRCNVLAGNTNYQGTCGAAFTCAPAGEVCNIAGANFPASYCCDGLVCDGGYSTPNGGFCKR